MPRTKRTNAGWPQRCVRRRNLGQTAPNPRSRADVRDGVVVGAASPARRSAARRAGRWPRRRRPRAAQRSMSRWSRARTRRHPALRRRSRRGHGPRRLRRSRIPTRASPVGASRDCARRGSRSGRRRREARRDATIRPYPARDEGRPMVTLKLARTADGYAAGDEHDPRLAITGEAANRRCR